MTLRPFWRRTPLTPHESQLIDLVLAAHAQSALRDSASTVALKMAAAGSGRLESGLIAALASVGGPHAPIAEICAFLDGPDLVRTARVMIQRGEKIPGWGNSFFKGKPDADWALVDNEIDANWPQQHDRMHEVTLALHERGIQVYPNAGCYTALTARILGMPPKLAPFLFIQGRLAVWSALVVGLGPNF